MSVGTSDTTVISSPNPEARNLNTIDASAAQRDDSSPAPKNRQLELKEELDEVRENFAAHMLLAICPDVNTNVLNFFGRQRIITTSEFI